MADAVFALAPEPRAGWGIVLADAGGLVTVTVPAVPGSGVPVLDSILPLVTPLAWTSEGVKVVVELLQGDESLTDEVVTTMMRELTAAWVWTERSCPRERPDA